MSASRLHTYIIAYDIADPSRLRRVHRYLKAVAFPVQYSVFIARLTEATLAELLDDLQVMIAPKEDDLRAYPLPQNADSVTLGRSSLPEDLILATGDWSAPALDAPLDT
jgi:CRISPR-associated protein Cas2